MGNKKGLLLLFSVVIMSFSIIVASKFISEAINNVGHGILVSNTTTPSNGNYELLVNDGWVYLIDTNSGQVWKKADNDDPESKWEEVRHFTE
ncbi:hypothetical protein [Fredinandcohnia onubensis]|uniref:hypothetical protein n=1 Tax=Fredinandcohnia onubensis TaxID=1571209 RepID=UPI000C0BCD82|nr:hypothetical protein [Fredinandcohnia onubensis]